MEHMKAIPTPDTSRREMRRGLRFARASIPLALFVMSLQVGAQGQGQTAAVLKQHEVDFFYRSSVVIYSCIDLENRVANIFRVLGARDDVEVAVNGCDAVMTPMDQPQDTWQSPSSRPQDTWQSPSAQWGTTSPSSRWQTSSDRFGNRSGREQSAHVRVRMMIPVEMTPEILAEMQKDKSRRELVSRVTGNPAANLNDPIIFPAERRSVTLSRRTIDLQPEDCELLEQMSRSVFRELDMKVVGRGAHCSRNEVSSLPTEVTVETLMPVMPPTPQLPAAPSESGSDPSTPAATDPKSSEPSEPGTATPQE
jgi:hypothetical protein